MFIIDLLLALGTALILSIIFVAIFGWKRPGSATGDMASFLFLFFVLFLATWAGAVWMQPLGSDILGSYWLGFVISGILFTLFLMAIIPPLRRKPEPEEKPDTETAESAPEKLGFYFYLMLIVFAIMIIISYVY